MMARRAPIATNPTLTVARLMLESYPRSGWILLDVFLALGIIAISVRSVQPGQSDVAAFYSVVMPLFLGATVLGTVVLSRRSMGARILPILARLPSRASLPAGLALAAGALRLPLILLLIVLGLLTRLLPAPTPGPLLAGGVALLATSVVLSTLTVALSAPVATRRLVIGSLAWLLLVLFPDGQVRGLPGILHGALGILRLPLWPLAATYNAADSAALGGTALLALAVEIAYLAGLAWVAGRLLERRDLLFD